LEKSAERTSSIEIFVWGIALELDDVGRGEREIFKSESVDQK